MNQKSIVVVALIFSAIAPHLFAGSMLTPSNELLAKSKYIALATVTNVEANMLKTGETDGQKVTLVIDGVIAGEIKTETVTLIVNRPLNALSGEANITLSIGDTGVWFISEITDDNQILLIDIGRGFARLPSSQMVGNTK